MGITSAKLRNSAKGQVCTFQIPSVCNCDPSTTVLAHIRDETKGLIALQGETGIGFDIPSFSAFNRYSTRLAEMTRRLEQTREIAGAISDRFDAATSDDLTLIAAEAIKTLVFELLQEGGEAGLDPKGAMQLAGALYRATQAQGVSTTRRLKVEKEFEEKAEAAIEKVAGEMGASAERIAQLRREFLGVRPKKKDDGE